MQNLELKARYPDLKEAKKRVALLKARFEKRLHQIDTYFKVSTGRLKLREINANFAQLIYYLRSDQVNFKLSEYEIYTLKDEVEKLKRILGNCLGVFKVVEKTREVFWYKNIRIHLDQVKGLGNFLEFEGVLSKQFNETATRKELVLLQKHFHIPKEALIEVSYAEMIIKS